MTQKKAQKKSKSAKPNDDLSDIGAAASFEMKPFLAVMIIVIAFCLLLWVSFQGERNPVDAPQSAVIEVQQPAGPEVAPVTPLRRQSR